MLDLNGTPLNRGLDYLLCDACLYKAEANSPLPVSELCQRCLQKLSRHIGELIEQLEEEEEAT